MSATCKDCGQPLSWEGPNDGEWVNTERTECKGFGGAHGVYHRVDEETVDVSG